MNPHNPFAVLRLPANATAVEIKSAGQLALAKLRLGDAGNTARIREVETAIEQLRDPVMRFKMGLEWPSLGPSAAKILATDETFDSLTSDWGRERSKGIKQLVHGELTTGAQHIWAVFLLLRAHEIFSRALKLDKSSNNQGLIIEDNLARVSEFFSKATNQWVLATSSPHFWMAQRLRAKEISDPRVNDDLISSCERESFAIAAENFAALASNALRLRNAQVCTAIVKGLKFSGADQSKIDQILSEIYKPICARIETGLEPLQRKLKSTTSKLTTTYSSLLAEYVQDVQPDIALLIAVGDLPGTTEERCRDAVAQFLRSLSVESANHADAYDVAKQATLLAQQVVDSAQIRKTLADDAEQINKIKVASETAKRTAPLYAELQAAIASNNLKTAAEIVDRLIVADPEHAIELRKLAMEIQLRRFLSHPVPNFLSDPPTIRNEREKTTGCLVPLALATTGIAVTIVGWNAIIG